jgi:hypothetical protein
VPQILLGITVTVCIHSSRGDKMKNIRDIGFEKGKAVVNYLKNLKYKIFNDKFQNKLWRNRHNSKSYNFGSGLL